MIKEGPVILWSDYVVFYNNVIGKFITSILNDERFNHIETSNIRSCMEKWWTTEIVQCMIPQKYAHCTSCGLNPLDYAEVTMRMLLDACYAFECGNWKYRE